MTHRHWLLAPLVSIAVLGPAAAHDEAPAAPSVLGKVSFPTTCDPKVQALFERGVAMLHSFWYSAAEQTFRDVLKADPQCAIANWGIASILMSNALAGQGASAKGAVTAQAAIDEGRRTGAKSQRERDYLDAVAAYYQDFAKRTEYQRQVTRAQAYEALASRYPADDEAQIFFALYNAATQRPSDQTYAAYLRSAAVLEQQFRKYPDHPGVAHYLIHSYDAPPLAEKGLDAARRYAQIAPAAPHALHMPSHIFTRVGAWEESVATNLRSRDVAIAGGEPDEAYHASDYMVYADLQLGRDADARRAIADIAKVDVASSPRFTSRYAMAAMPARYVFERGSWSEAAALTPVGSSYPFVEAITSFARSVGEARSGDLAAARRDAEQLTLQHEALISAQNGYWATEVEVQRLAAAAWIMFGDGRRDEALAYMRDAADLEDKSEKHIVTPGRVVPARELLGDMLLEARQPAAALQEYETSQQREPNRFRGLLGCARAAEAAGDRERASAYYRRLLALASRGDGERPELAVVREKVARR